MRMSRVISTAIIILLLINFAGCSNNEILELTSQVQDLTSQLATSEQVIADQSSLITELEDNYSNLMAQFTDFALQQNRDNNDLILDPFEFPILLSYEDIVNHFGEPLDFMESNEPDLYTQSYIKLTYENIEIFVADNTRPIYEILTTEYQLRNGIRIGDSYLELIKKMGAPDSTLGESRIFYNSSNKIYSLQFDITNNEISGIVFLENL